jgi:hypothetical protein
MSDAIAPFLRELGDVADQFRWIVCKKTGRIVGWHPEMKEHLSPIQAVAWAETKKFISDEYEAARSVGLESIAYALTQCCNYHCDKAWRKAVLIEVGLDWMQ